MDEPCAFVVEVCVCEVGDCAVAESAPGGAERYKETDGHDCYRNDSRGIHFYLVFPGRDDLARQIYREVLALIAVLLEHNLIEDK